MPTYITSIHLLAANETDVEKLNEAMKAKSFLSTDQRSAKEQAIKGPIVYMATTKANLVDTSTDVSTAASSVGRKFFFTIRKDK
jgi:hypothetical protein